MHILGPKNGTFCLIFQGFLDFSGTGCLCFLLVVRLKLLRNFCFLAIFLVFLEVNWVQKRTQSKNFEFFKDSFINVFSARILPLVKTSARSNRVPGIKAHKLPCNLY